MIEATTRTTYRCQGRIIRIDPDFVMLTGGLSFWLQPSVSGEGIHLGDEVQIEYDIQTMMVVRIAKAVEQV